MLLLTLRGTPTLYYGDELVLQDVAIPSDRVQDPWAKNEPGLGFGRDPERTPMPWDASANAGFTTGNPWLPLNPDYSERNVAAFQADPHSILNLYRDLIALRRDHPGLSTGRYLSRQTSDDVFAFERTDQNDRLLVVLNFASEPRHVARPAGARVLLSTCHDRATGHAAGDLTLRAYEGVILELPTVDQNSEETGP
jgi:alpha-glucosidase